MENILIVDNDDEAVYTKEICNKRCLQYKSKFKGENILKVPQFIKWFNEEKEKEKQGRLYKCIYCNFYAYLKSRKNFKCCKRSYYLDTFCEFCGRYYYESAYCCPKRGLIEVYRKYLLYGLYTCEIMDGELFLTCAKFVPIIIIFMFIGTIYFGLFFQRNLTEEEKGTSNYGGRETICSHIMMFISGIIIVIMTIIYFFPLLIVYFIYLITFYKAKKSLALFNI